MGTFQRWTPAQYGVCLAVYAAIAFLSQLAQAADPAVAPVPKIFKQSKGNFVVADATRVRIFAILNVLVARIGSPLQESRIDHLSTFPNCCNFNYIVPTCNFIVRAESCYTRRYSYVFGGIE
jgi:hypothetical protein